MALETREPQQLGQAVTVSPDAVVIVQEPDGVAKKLPIGQLFGRFLGVDVSYETLADLEEDLEWAANSIALVYADPTAGVSGFYLKSGDIDAGEWTLTRLFQGEQGEQGEPGTLEDNEGFTAGGPSSIQGDSATLYQLKMDDGTVVAVFSSLEAFVGAGTTTQGGQGWRVGTLSSPIDSAFVAARDHIGVSSFVDEFRDGGRYASTVTGGRCSFDSNFEIVDPAGGPSNLNHAVSGQSRIIYSGTGTIDRIQGFSVNHTVNSGTVSQLFGLYLADVVKAGGATIGQHVGIYSDVLTGGTGTNYGAILQNDCYFGGNVQFGGALNGITTVTASGDLKGSCMNVTGGVTSFDAGGGAYFAGNGASPADLRAYGNGAGSAKQLRINKDGGEVVIGNASSTTAARLQVNGGIAPINHNTDDLATTAVRFKDTFLVNAPTVSSDGRIKQDVGAIPDAWLDAWAEVEWERYRYIEAVEAKGDEARWHLGAIAQKIRDAFARHGIDACSIGLLCFDKWDAHLVDEFAPVTKTRLFEKPVAVHYDLVITEHHVVLGVEGDATPKAIKKAAAELIKAAHPDGGGDPLEAAARIEQLQRARDVLLDPVQLTAARGKGRRIETREVEEKYETLEPTGKKIVAREAGELWSLRYDQCWAIEAAYQRRRMARIEARLDELALPSKGSSKR